MGSKIEAIKTRISDLTRSLQTYGVNAIKEEGLNSAFDRQRQLRWSYSHIVEEYIVGLDEDIEDVVVQLINENKHCQVVSICEILTRVQFCPVFVHVSKSKRVQCSCALDPSRSPSKGKDWGALDPLRS